MNEKEYQEILKMLQDNAKNQYGYTGPLVGMTEGMSYEDHIDALESQINELQRGKKVEVYVGDEKAPNNMATMPALPTMGGEKEPIEYNINMLDTTPTLNKKGMMMTKQFRDGGTLDQNIATYGSAIPGFLTAFAEKGAYDTRVGMEKPSMKQMLDFRGAQIGSQFGLPGLAVGAGIDVAKNLVSMKKQARAYDTAKSKTDFNQERADQQMEREPDYTGLTMSGRYGMSTNPYSKYMGGGMVPNYGYGGKSYENGGMVDSGDPTDPPKIFREFYKSKKAYNEALRAQQAGQDYKVNPLAEPLMGSIALDTGNYDLGIRGRLMTATNQGQPGMTPQEYFQPLIDDEMEKRNKRAMNALPTQYRKPMKNPYEPKYSDQFYNRAAPNVPPTGTEKATGLYKKNYRPKR
jgi:hypothetical protein